METSWLKGQGLLVEKIDFASHRRIGVRSIAASCLDYLATVRQRYLDSSGCRDPAGLDGSLHWRWDEPDVGAVMDHGKSRRAAKSLV